MVIKPNNMSSTITDIMKTLASNTGIVKLLANNNDNPFGELANIDSIKKNIMKPNHCDSKILPYPFDLEATMDDGSFIRVYFNQGSFNSNETISQSEIFIDIVVARSLWLVHGGAKGSETIRPYEIMDRVIDAVGRRSMGGCKRIRINGFQHLYINTKFDAIRLYCSDWAVETDSPDPM